MFSDALIPLKSAYAAPRGPSDQSSDTSYPPVLSGHGLCIGLYQASLGKALESSADLATIEIEGPSNLATGGLVPARDLVQDSCFAQCERTAVQAGFKQSKRGGVYSVENSEICNLRSRLSCMPTSCVDWINIQVASINCQVHRCHASTRGPTVKPRQAILISRARPAHISSGTWRRLRARSAAVRSA